MKKEVIIGDKTYYVAKPTAPDEGKAKLQQSKTFSQALENGACLKVQLNKVLKQRKIWDEEDDKEIEELTEKLAENLNKLEEGGFDIMEARKLAIETYRLRMAVVAKGAVLREHNSLTAEGQADDAYFDTLVACCCYNEDGTKVFKNYEDYINKSEEEYAVLLAQELSKIIYGNLDYIKELPENQFLQEFGFINDNLEYIDENGNRVNDDYEPVVEENKEEKPKRKPFLKNGEPINKE